MDLELDGRVVLVTGASAGIGLATVEHLVREGAKVAGCARDGERLERATAHLPQEQLLTASCDVTVKADVDAFVAAVQERFGGVDGLVLNAGRSQFGGLDAVTEEVLREEYELKFRSVLHPLEATRPLLRESDVASIVVVNSLLSVQPERFLVATGAARAGLLNFVKAIAADLADEGTRINSLLLGLIDTDQWKRRYDAAPEPPPYEEWAQDIARDRGVLLGRFGRPEEVAAMAVVLLSPKSSYVTGASLEVSGGVGRHI